MGKHYLLAFNGPDNGFERQLIFYYCIGTHGQKEKKQQDGKEQLQTDASLLSHPPTMSPGALYLILQM